MDHRGPGTGNPGRPDLLPQTYAGTVGPESPPTKESRGRGQDWGSIFGFMEIWTVFASLFSGPVIWPLSGWMGQEVHSQISSSPDWCPEALIQEQHVWTARGE